MPGDAPGVEAPKTTRVSPPGTSKSDKGGLDGAINKTELKRLMAAIYNIPSQLGLVDQTFEESEFAGASDQLVDVIDRAAPLRILLRIIAPIVGVADLLGKARRIVESYQDKQAAKRAAKGQNANGSQPDQTVDVERPVRFPGFRRG